MWRVYAYLAAITTANVVTASFAPMIAGPLIIPWGSYFVGATFVLRDLVQNRYGKTNAYKTIVAALILSALISYALGDSLMIVLASAITFAVAESADTEIYSRIRASVAKRVFYSGLVGGFLDSTIFVIIGLSPIGAGFVPWSAVPYAILGQMIIKFAMQAIGAFLIFKGFGIKYEEEQR